MKKHKGKPASPEAAPVAEPAADEARPAPQASEGASDPWDERTDVVAGAAADEETEDAAERTEVEMAPVVTDDARASDVVTNVEVVETVLEADAITHVDLLAGEASERAGVDGDGAGAAAALPAVDASRLESILESLLFAADRPLTLSDLKRLLADRDGKRIAQGLENLRQRHAGSGIQLISVAGGWQLRTHPANGAWVARLVAGRPPRLSRAMMETLSIVAYRQPVTRPEIDEIRGVDCGPVLRTLLDRGLIRVIGKKEEVGRPILYGTTPEFLKIFSLRDLTDLPTLRDFHELGAEDRAQVDARTGRSPDAGPGGATDAGDIAAGLEAGDLPDVNTAEEDVLMEELDRASAAATVASGMSPSDETRVDDEAAAAAGPLADGER